MFWLQVGISFAVWIGAAFFVKSKTDRIKAWMVLRPTGTRKVMGTVGFVIAIVVLAGILTPIAGSDGIGKDGLALWAWLLVTAAGLLFTLIQAISAAAILSLLFQGETNELPDTSEPHESPGP
jgi:hypothetical protein